MKRSWVEGTIWSIVYWLYKFVNLFGFVNYFYRLCRLSAVHISEANCHKSNSMHHVEVELFDRYR